MNLPSALKHVHSLCHRAKLYRALTFSLTGLAAAFRSERAFRQEVALAFVLVPLGLWLGDTGVERALLVGSLMLVMIVELINTAIETLVERISPEWHTLSGRAKDIGSAAVFLALAAAVATWLLVLLA